MKQNSCWLLPQLHFLHSFYLVKLLYYGLIPAFAEKRQKLSYQIS